jgi:hypothetical protein
MFSLLIIRFCQLKRILSSIGVFRSIIVILLLLLALVSINYYSHSTSAIKIVFISYVLLILYIHFNRNDKAFIYKHIKNPIFSIFLEYFTFSLPIIIILTIYKPLTFPFILFAILFISSLNINSNKRSRNNKIFKKIPTWHFEWISGFRKYYYSIILLYIISIFLSFIPFASFVCSTAITIVLISFYDETEPRNLIEVFQLSTRKFLLFKVFSAIKLYMIIIIPLLSFYLIFNIAHWHICIYFLLNSLLTVSYSVLLKYSSYSYQTASNSVNPILKGIAAVNIILPVVFVPLVFLLNFYFFFKSFSNLNPILNDFD